MNTITDKRRQEILFNFMSGPGSGAAKSLMMVFWIRGGKRTSRLEARSFLSSIPSGQVDGAAKELIALGYIEKVCNDSWRGRKLEPGFWGILGKLKDPKAVGYQPEVVKKEEIAGLNQYEALRRRRIREAEEAAKSPPTKGSGAFIA